MSKVHWVIRNAPDSHQTSHQSGESYLHCVSSCIPSCLAPHKLKPITPATQDSRHKGNPAAVVVLEIGAKGRLGNAKGWLVQEDNIDEHSAEEKRNGEVEECRVHDQVIDPGLELVPLIVCG